MAKLMSRPFPADKHNIEGAECKCKSKDVARKKVDRYELQMARVRAGLRQYELAQLLGVPATIVCDVERGRRPVTEEWERRIREALARRGSMDGNAAGEREQIVNVEPNRGPGLI